MRKLILKMHVSIDGFVAGPNGEADWIFKSQDEGVTAWLLDTLQQAGAHIMGSRTFHDMAAYWPTSPGPLAAPMNEIPKVVFSKKGIIEPVSPAVTTRSLRDATDAMAANGLKPLPALSPSATTWDEASVAGGVSRSKSRASNISLARISWLTVAGDSPRAWRSLGLSTNTACWFIPWLWGVACPCFLLCKNRSISISSVRRRLAPV